MDAAVEATRRTLAALDPGRAAPELLDRVRVKAYGDTPMPIAQLAQVGVQPPRGLIITPHDPQLLSTIERALLAADLGAQPSSDGVRIRLELPAPSAERRAELVAVARREAEAGKVAVRNIRRDAINDLRRKRKADEISEAKLNGRSKHIQAATDEHIAKIDGLLAAAVLALTSV